MLAAALSPYIRDLAVAAHAARRGGQRRSRLRYQGPATRPVPMIRAPAEESGLRSQHPMQTIPGSWAQKSRPQVYRSYTLRQPRKHADPAGRPDATRRATPATAGRSARAACRCRYVPAARPHGPHDASQPWPRAADPPAPRVFPDIHPPTQAPSRQQVGTQAPPRCPPGTPGTGTPGNQQPPAPASQGKRPAQCRMRSRNGHPRGPCPWASVESRRLHRPSTGPDAVLVGVRDPAWGRRLSRSRSTGAAARWPG